MQKTPWMADCEVEIMDALFKAQRPKRVLEWGAGGSTLYWPQKYPFIEEWVAFEHDEVFAAAVGDAADGKVDVLHLEAPQYWTWVELLGAFDLILVDGQYRVECLKAARTLLAEGGIVVLHDSGRAAYNEAWKLWRHSEELYRGELPTGDGYYKHRGITVFWQDDGVKQAGWCRKHQGGALERPHYKPPRRRNAEFGMRSAE